MVTDFKSLLVNNSREGKKRLNNSLHLRENMILPFRKDFTHKFITTALTTDFQGNVRKTIFHTDHLTIA